MSSKRQSADRYSRCGKFTPLPLPLYPYSDTDCSKEQELRHYALGDTDVDDGDTAVHIEGAEDDEGADDDQCASDDDGAYDNEDVSEDDGAPDDDGASEGDSAYDDQDASENDEGYADSKESTTCDTLSPMLAAIPAGLSRKKGPKACGGALLSTAQLSLARLCKTDATAAEVLHDVRVVIPDPLPTAPDIANFLTRASTRTHPPPSYPKYRAKFATWPKVSPELDEDWDSCVAGEPQPRPAEHSKVDMRREWLVKPQGSFEVPVMIFST